MDDEGDFRTDILSVVDSSVLRSGIPRSMDKMVTDDEDDADLVYRNVDVMSGNSVRRAAGGDYDCEVLRSVSSVSMGTERKGEPSIFHSMVVGKPQLHTLSQPSAVMAGGVGGKVTGKYQLTLSESVQATMQRVSSFMVDHSITSTQRSEGATQCWDCHTISSSCQLVKFQVQVVQTSAGVVVDFKRERGCCDALSGTFDEFRRAVGCPSMPSKAGGRFRMAPPPLPEDDDEGGDGDCSIMAQALTAMSQWIQSSPVEALQSLGQLYGNKCQYLLQNENLLSDVCLSVKTHEVEGSDLIALTLALSCLCKILSIYAELSSPSPMSADLLGMVNAGLARAANGKCLTARREAGLTLETINKTVPSDLRIVNL